MRSSPTTTPSVPSTKNKGLHALLQELSDDEDMAVDTGVDVPNDPRQPWLRDYHGYMDVCEQVPEGGTAVQWWGVRISN